MECIKVGESVEIMTSQGTKEGVVVRKEKYYYYVRVKMLYTKIYKVTLKEILKGENND